MAALHTPRVTDDYLAGCKQYEIRNLQSGSAMILQAAGCAICLKANVLRF